MSNAPKKTKIKFSGGKPFFFVNYVFSNKISIFVFNIAFFQVNFIIIIITVYKMMTSRGLAAKTLKVKSK